jgi:uncharacterized protein with GYD domain
LISRVARAYPLLKKPKVGRRRFFSRSAAKRGDVSMSTFVTLYTFTEQGARAVKDTVKRAQAVRTAAGESGITVKEIYWLQGAYDLVVISEAPDEATATAFALNVLKAGNVRGQTLRAFTAQEMSAILEKVA